LGHLNECLIILEAVLTETADENPDIDFLTQAVEAMKNLQNVVQLETFRAGMNKGSAGVFGWHDLVHEDVRKGIPEQVAKRQV